MYNDYYLEQINNKLTNTNLYLQEITENQETIIQNQQTLISGDVEIKSKLTKLEEDNLGLAMILLLALTYTFIKGCFRC